MSWTKNEMLPLIQRYIKDRKGTDVSIDEIWKKPWHQQVGWWKDALAYYKMNNHVFDLADADPSKLAFLRKDGVTEEYRYINGKWRYEQEVPDTLYKE